MQDGIKDCGICSLLSIIRFYGGDVSKEYLRELTSTTKDGVSMYNLLEAAKTIGFDAYGMNGEIEKINVNNLPCIVHFIVNKSYHHFVVIYNIDNKKNKVTLMDPAKGKKIISISEFKLLSSNNYLFLHPNKKLPVIRNNKMIEKIIQNNFKTNKTLYLLSCFTTIIAFFENFILSFSFKYYLNYSINLDLTSNILTISILLLIITLYKNINITLKNTLINKWLTYFDDSLTTITYQQILLLPYLYYKNRTTGEVISRFKDLNTIRNYLGLLFSSFLTDLQCIIFFISIMFYYSKLLTSIIFIFLIISFSEIVITSRKKKKYLEKLTKHQDFINTYLVEGLSNVDTIKGSHLEKRLIDKFNIRYKNFLEAVYSYNLFLELISLVKNNLKEILSLIILGIGSYLVVENKLDLGNLIIYQSLSFYLLDSVFNITRLLEEYPEYRLAKDRVEELFMLDNENFKNNYFYLSYKLVGDIFINNLNYKVGAKVLFSNLSLTIRRGEKVLLTGESGSGKSTLVKTLLKYIEVPYNTIKIDNIDINHYHLENIRKNITYLTANEYLFNDTIKNNITLSQEYSNEEINKVVEICNINELIQDSTLGLEKRIEENGFNFSNGERQRIILARSIIKKSSIYIFDEALGQIDIHKEKIILEKIFNYLNDKTIIVISHRSNNKKLFDRVLKLERGKIRETKSLSK